MSVCESHHSIIVTFFADRFAQEKREESCTLPELADRICTTAACEKSRLPMLKFARFGVVRTDKGSLRHDANVIAITGIEADYDAGRMPIGEAVELLTKQGVRSLVYTTPSHTEDSPRWRVLAPFSHELQSTRRRHLLGRLNGLFRGIFAGESWSLSQSFYFGSVAQNPSHCVHLIGGMTIDQHDDLDPIWVGKHNRPASDRPSSPHGAYIPVSDARLEGFRHSLLSTLRREAADGQKHFTLLRIAITLGGIQEAAGFSDETAICWLLDALPDTVRDWTAAKKTAADGLARGRAKPIDFEDRPLPAAEARRAVARITHRMAAAWLPADEIIAAVLAEAERRGMQAGDALALASRILQAAVAPRNA